MAQTVPSFVNALGMARSEGHAPEFRHLPRRRVIGFGLTAQLANVLLLRGGLRTVPLYSLCLAAILTATALCFPPARRSRRRKRRAGAGLRPWPVPARQSALLPAAGGRVPAVLRP